MTEATTRGFPDVHFRHPVAQSATALCSIRENETRLGKPGGERESAPPGLLHWLDATTTSTGTGGSEDESQDDAAYPVSGSASGSEVRMPCCRDVIA